MFASIEKLNGDNWQLWSAKMKMSMIGAGIWDVVRDRRHDSTSSGPGTSSAASATSSMASSEKTGEGDEWQRRSERALAIICMSLDDRVLTGYGILEARTAAEAWRILETSFASSGMARQLFLRERLAQLRMDDGGDVRDYIRDVGDVTDQLAVAGASLPEKEIVAKILTGLPSSWRPLVSMLECMDEQRLTRGFVTERILHERMVRREHEQRSAAVVMSPATGAMVAASAHAGAGSGHGEHRGSSYAHGRGRGFRTGGGAGGASFRGRCFICNKPGHIARDCLLRARSDDGPGAGGASYGGPPYQFQARAAAAVQQEQPQSQQPQRSQQQPGNASSSSMATLQHFLFTAGVGGSHGAPSEWILDSGASSHMCCSMEHFLHYAPQSSDSKHEVVIGDGRKLRVAGVGNVRLLVNGATQAGEPRTHVVHLVGALHVPDLSTNLFSVGNATHAGHLVRFEGDHCDIVDPSGVVVVHARRSLGDGLYKFGTTLQTAHDAVAQLELPDVCALLAEVPVMVSQQQLWHERFGHIPHVTIMAMQQHGIVTGLNLQAAGAGGSDQREQHPFCVACAQGKQHAEPIRISNVPNATRAQAPLELVHTDVVGPMRTVSHEGYRFFISLVDDFSRRVWVLPLKLKADVLEVFTLWHATVEKQTGRVVKAVRSDNGGEYIGLAFEHYLQQRGIVHQRSAPYTPQQNGVAERSNRSVMEMARAMMHHAHLDYTFWVEAVGAAAYVKNRCAHRALPAGITPEEAYSGVKPDVGNLRVFGCDAYLLVPEELRHKLESKSHRCVFLGYTMEPGTFRFWDPQRKRVIASRNVIFNEVSFLGPSQHVASQPQSGSDITADAASSLMPATAAQQVPQQAGAVTAGDADADAQQHAQWPIAGGAGGQPQPVGDRDGHMHGSSGNDGDTDAHDGGTSSNDEEGAAGGLDHVSNDVASWPQQQQLSSSSSQLRPRVRTPYAAARPQRVRRPPSEYWKASGSSAMSSTTSSAMLANVVNDEPESVQQALSRGDASHWRVAIAEELEAIRSNGVYELVDPPVGHNVVTSKFVFRIKRRPDGEVDRYKARLVARGFTQQEGVDYTETFAPVAKFSTIRALLAVAAARGLTVHQLDVKTAFLHGELEEEVYLQPPAGVEHPDIVTGKVWRLRKALYGLKQAPRQWNIKLHDFLVGLGFRRTESDHSLYVRRTPASPSYCSLLVYVDDILVVGAHQTVLEVKQALAAQFPISDFSDVHWLLGIEVKRVGDVFHLSQRKYVEDMLQRFGMADCRPISTPLGAGERLVSAMSVGTAAEMEEMRSIPYRSAVGSLMYLMVATRPDLAAAVGTVSRFLEKPGPKHWQAVKRIFRYLRATSDMVLQLGARDAARGEVILQGYCDADWAGDDDTRRSTTGYVFGIGTGVISWNSKRQPTVALSTTEAEYMSASAAAREAVWLRALLEEVGFPQQQATTVYCDNSGAIALARNPVQHQRSKHIDIRHHFIRSVSEAGEVELVYVPTHEQVADVLTKPLTGDKHTKCCVGLGLLKDYG